MLECGEEGDSAVDVTNCTDRDGGETRIGLRIGLDIRALTAGQRGALAAASSGTDAQVRAAIVANLPAAWAAMWDALPALDEASDPDVPTRVRVRAALADLA